MAALFERLAAVSRRAVETVNGETVTVRPMDVAGPNARPVASSSRATFSTVALFYQDSTDDLDRRVQPLVPGAGQALLHRSPRFTASIRLPATPAIRTGDMIERDGGELFEIAEIHPDGLGGAMLTLSARKA